MSEIEEKCPCGLDATYAQCCGRYHNNTERPPTAESLMRSRYSAFVKKNWRWLVETHDPRTRGELDEAQLERSSGRVQWLGLTVVSTWQGGAKDKVGKVEFVAQLVEPDGRNRQFHERSRFRRFKGRWIYVDGETQERP